MTHVPNLDKQNGVGTIFFWPLKCSILLCLWEQAQGRFRGTLLFADGFLGMWKKSLPPLGTRLSQYNLQTDYRISREQLLKSWRGDYSMSMVF